MKGGVQGDYGRRKKGEKWDYMEGGQNNKGGGGRKLHTILPSPTRLFTGSAVFRPEFRGYENRKCHWVVWRGSIPLTCGKHHQPHCTFFYFRRYPRVSNRLGGGQSYIFIEWQ